MNKIGAVIAIVVVLIVVISGSLVLSGTIKLPSSNSNTTTTGSTNGSTTILNSNIQQKAPNVVSSSAVNSSLGGQWVQRAGASGSASNLSSASSITSFGMVGPSSSPYKADLSVGVRGIVDPQFNIVTPMTTSTQNFNPSNITIKQFEANLYEPSGSGFAALGYIQFANSTDASYVYGCMNSSAHLSYNYSTGQKIFLTNGLNYLYQWTQSGFGINQTMWNLSITIGLDGAYMIGIFYFTPDNLSLNHFTSLLSAEISKLSNPSSNIINNVFLTESQVKAQTNMPFVQEVSIIVGISNGIEMFNEYAKAYNLEPNSLPASDHLLINDTIGNLSLIGLSEYTAGEYNYSSQNGLMSGSAPIMTIVGIANFTNTNIPTTIFLGISQIAAGEPGAAANSSSGNIQYGNLGSGQYLYIHGYAGTSYSFSNGQEQELNYGNASVIFSYEGSFVTVIEYVGHYALSKTAVLNLLSEEYSYL